MNADLHPWLVPFALLLPLFAVPRSRTAPIELTRFKITHALPTAIQLTVFCYWALYWTQLRSYAPWLVAQLAFAYLAEALAQWQRWGRWRPTTAPLPVTLSTNLFVQFGPMGGAWQLSAIAIALVSKELIRRKGRHVFNPSAFGILVVGVVELVAFRTSSAGDPSFEFSFAPNMAEVLLLLALIVQLRVPVVLCTLGALVTMQAMLLVHPNANWLPVWAPVLLVLLLLITDPATSPRSALGKLFFGACAALGMGLARYGLDTAGVSDFYGKLVGVVVANSLTDVFDRWAAAIERRWPSWIRLLDPRFNAIHVALTFALAASLMSGKRGVFLDAAQQESMRVEEVPGLVEGRDGSFSCEDNPAWCKPFSFLEELAVDRTPPSPDER